MSLLLRFRQAHKLYIVPSFLESAYSSNSASISSSAPKIRNYVSSSTSSDRPRGNPVSLPPQRRPAWLDQQEKPSSSGEHQSEGRFAINSAATAENFVRFLEILKKRQPIPDWARSAGDASGSEGGGDRQQYKSILYTAPYLADLYGRGEEFADVVSEWFHQARPLFQHDTRRGEITVSLQFSPNVDQASKWKRTMTPVFNISHHIEHLGRLNKLTKGRLVENLEWRNVSYLARRMMECGFFTYTFVDVGGSSLNGLVDLYLSNPDPPNRLLYGEGLRLWLLGLAHYLAAAESKPYEWRHLIGELGDSRSAVPGMVNSLRQLHSSFLLIEKAMPEKTNVAFKYLFKTLCNYARIHFDDDVVEDCRLAMERGRISAQLNVPRATRFLNNFAEAWARYRPKELLESEMWAKFQTPDYFIRGTWASWFQACNVVLSQLLLTDQYFKETLSNERKEESREETDLMEGSERSLNKNYSCVRSANTVRLIDNALIVAFEFGEAGSFYEFLFETWIKMFEKVERGVAPRDLSFIISKLLRIAVDDAHQPTGQEEADEDEEAGQEFPKFKILPQIRAQRKTNQGSGLQQPTDQKPVWRARHEKTLQLAMGLLKKTDPQEFSFRAMHHLLVEMNELKKLGKFDDAVMRELVVFMRQWFMVRGRRPKISPAAAKTIKSIQEIVQEMKLDAANVRDLMKGVGGIEGSKG